MNYKHIVQQKFPSILALVKDGINIKEASLVNGIHTGQLYKFITPLQKTELKQVKATHAFNMRHYDVRCKKADLQILREAFYEDEAI